MFGVFESFFYKHTTQRNLVYIGFVATFVAIFALNYFFPVYADDMMYSVIKYQESLNLGEDLKEIGSFLHYYYFNWGGRVVAHLFAHLLLLFGSLGQAAINTLVYCILLFLIYSLTKQRGVNNVFVFTFVAISVFYFTPSFLSSAIWKTGSANYLWTTALALAFIYPYYKLFNGKEYKSSVFRSILFFFFGILAGWTNENLGPTLFLIVVGYVYLFYSDRHRDVPAWAVFGFMGLAIGCLVMILAPGNAVRAEMEGYSGLFNSFDIIVKRLENLKGTYRYFMLRLIILYVVFFLANFVFPKDVGQRSKIVIQSLLFFVAANISIWATLLSPNFPPRAFMCTTVLAIVAVAMLYANINVKQIVPKILNVALLAVLIFYASIDYITFLKGTYFLHSQIQLREIMIDEAKEKGETSIEFDAIHMDYRFEYTDFANYYKDYYNIDAIFIENNE